jgi:hypothetical protein
MPTSDLPAGSSGTNQYGANSRNLSCLVLEFGFRYDANVSDAHLAKVIARDFNPGKHTADFLSIPVLPRRKASIRPDSCDWKLIALRNKPNRK